MLCGPAPQVLERCRARLAEFDTRGLTSLLASMGRLGRRDDDFSGRIIDRCAVFMPNLDARSLVSLVMGVSQQRQRPGAEWLDSFSGALAAKLDARAIEPSGLCIALFSLSKMGARPPAALTQRCCDALTASLAVLEGRDVAMAAAALGWFGFRPGQHRLVALLQRFGEVESTPQSVAMLVRALPRLLWGARQPGAAPLQLTGQQQQQKPQPQGETCAAPPLAAAKLVDAPAGQQALHLGQQQGGAQTAGPLPVNAGANEAPATTNAAPVPSSPVHIAKRPLTVPREVAAALPAVLQRCAEQMDMFNCKDVAQIASGLRELPQTALPLALQTGLAAAADRLAAGFSRPQLLEVQNTLLRWNQIPGPALAAALALHDLPA